MTSPDLSKSPNRRRRPESTAERVQAEVQKEELRQLNVAIPVDLHRKMRMRAVEEDITLREWCLKVFEASLQNYVSA